MKKILNKLTKFLILSVLIILTIINCKVQEQIKVGVTPVSQITPVLTSYSAQVTPEPAIIAVKTPSNTTKSIKIEKKVEYYILVTKWGSEGSEDGQFKNFNADNFYPINIVLDIDSYIYITDSGNCRIQKFDSNGNFILKWNSENTNKEIFKYFRNIGLDSDRNIYVTECIDGSHYKEKDKCFIQKLSLYKEFITEWQIEEIPEVLLVSKSKKVYSIYYPNYPKRQYVMNKYDSEGNVIITCDIGFGPDTLDLINGFHPTICSAAIDTQSNIFVLFKGFISPIAKYPGDPNAYYPPAKNFIKKFDSNGHLIKEYKEIYDDKKEKLVDCSDIAIDSEDNIFISDGITNHCIWKLDYNLNFITKFGSKGELKQPASLTVDSKGNVYVVDIGDFSIKKFKLKH